MDGCSTIVEVMEPRRCSGEGLSIDAAEFKPEVLRKETSKVLKSDSFLRCEHPVLELILSDDELPRVTELELFRACASWAEARKHPRQALGSTLGLIRFHLLTAQQFAKHVKPTKLLSAAEESDILSCLIYMFDD
ncbi:hypothetical protein B566_EDAN014191 [Ephemera danica]|nr:hypothetical protein B566_EDAN014191 [Ephemera danica]